MYKRILGRIKETKITDIELNWLYSTLIVGQPIDPSHLMINRWCCEAISGSRYIGSGCYLSMLAIALRPGITRNPEYLLVGTSLGIEYMKQGKYISGDERGGFKVVKVNLPLPDGRLRLFIEGKEDWLEEVLLVPAKKNKRGRIVEEGSSAAEEEEESAPKLCATIWRNSGAAKALRRCTNASMGEWCSHAPTKFCGTQRSLCGAICTPPSTTTKCDHHWRICCKKYAKYCSHKVQCKSNG
jgi:hypothetical protein